MTYFVFFQAPVLDDITPVRPLDRRHRDDGMMSDRATGTATTAAAADDPPTEESSASEGHGASVMTMSDEDHNASVADVVATGSGCPSDGTVAAATVTPSDPCSDDNVKEAPDSEIHTDRDDCSSDESNGPDSPIGVKTPVGSVYDFRVDGGADTDLTKVARKQLRMIREVDVAVCYLNHTNTIISKILSSKYLRRWDNHHIRLQDDGITSSTVSQGQCYKLRYLFATRVTQLSACRYSNWKN